MAMVSTELKVQFFIIGSNVKGKLFRLFERDVQSLSHFQFFNFQNGHL